MLAYISFLRYTLENHIKLNINIMKWETTSCNLTEVHQYFGGKHCLHFQGRRIS
jgi:hypothetical protein